MADPAPNSSPEIQDREHGFRLLMELQEKGRLDAAQLLVGELRARFGDGSELDYREGLNHFMAGRFGESQRQGSVVVRVRQRCRPVVHQSILPYFRSRRLFVTTLTLLSAIAAAATAGESCRPQIG